MSRNRGLMSEALKQEVARELGVYDTVARDGGWGAVSSKTCGNMVTKAIQLAELNLTKNTNSQ